MRFESLGICAIETVGSSSPQGIRGHDGVIRNFHLGCQEQADATLVARRCGEFFVADHLAPETRSRYDAGVKSTGDASVSRYFSDTFPLLRPFSARRSSLTALLGCERPKSTVTRSNTALTQQR